MKAKLYSYLLVAVLLIAAIWLVGRRKNSNPARDPVTKTSGRRYDPERKNGFIRKASYLEYTAHAKCRMKCRHITQAEVQDIMKNGNINYTKSDLNDTPCPTYALEGYTQADNQHVRIVFAQCLQKTKVVTCIDLDDDFACDCK